MSADRPQRRKPCRTCGEIKPLSEFHRDRTRPDGHMDQCRVCRSYAVNERRREYGREYRDEHTDEIHEHAREYAREYRQEHADEIRERNRAYHQEHRDEIRERKRRYRERDRQIRELFALIDRAYANAE